MHDIVLFFFAVFHWEILTAVMLEQMCKLTIDMRYIVLDVGDCAPTPSIISKA